MKLYNVVLGVNDKYNNNWSITKDQYDNDVVINNSTSQRIKIGKYLVPSITKLNEHVITTQACKDLVTVYDFSEDGHHVVNKKNLSIIMIKNSTKDKNDYTKDHLLYVTIPTDKHRIVDSNINLDCAEIINSYRSSGMIGAVIRIDKSLFPQPALESDGTKSAYVDYMNSEVQIGEFVLYNTEAEDDKKVVRKVITLDRDLSELHVATFFITNGYYKDITDQVVETNFFKKLMISPSKNIRTSVYIVNEKNVDEVYDMMGENEELTILGVNPKIFKNGTEEELIYFDNVMKDHVLNNRVKAVTVVGIKLPKEIYNKYHITTCFAHDLKNGIIRCVKC